MNQAPHWVFLNLREFPEYTQLIEWFFKNTLEPLYGNQDGFIKKTTTGKDRECLILFVENLAVGFIVYKNHLQNHGVELKTLSLIFPEKDSGRGFGSLLYQEVERRSRAMEAAHIFCTVYSNALDSLKCLLKNGYVIDGIRASFLDKHLFTAKKEIK